MTVKPSFNSNSLTLEQFLKAEPPKTLKLEGVVILVRDKQL